MKRTLFLVVSLAACSHAPAPAASDDLSTGTLSYTLGGPALHIDAPAASVLVTDLSERGWVTRSPDPEDGRRKVIEATDLGRAWVAEVRQLPTPPPMFEVLSATERQQLIGLLDKLRQAATS